MTKRSHEDISGVQDGLDGVNKRQRPELEHSTQVPDGAIQLLKTHSSELISCIQALSGDASISSRDAQAKLGTLSKKLLPAFQALASGDASQAPSRVCVSPTHPPRGRWCRLTDHSQRMSVKRQDQPRQVKKRNSSSKKKNSR